MVERAAGGRWGQIVPVGVMLAGVLIWLWPIGLGGRLPGGGDETQFSMGLMAFLRESLLAGRLPLWNDLWGFGFPGLAESQMGVFYPPHLLLYVLLPTETAYTSSLVLHTLWGSLGAYWASRQLGTSATGSALCGFAWSTCGFLLIHLPHQWGYTVGAWMPWAWGLAWQVIGGSGSRRTPWLLAAVLALQILPGHFQLAFVTEVGVLVIGLVGNGRSVRRRVAVILGLVAMVPLAAMQLWPTLQLARMSNASRDFEYLSGFAATPIHLISYVAPGLFHRSPLWRPLVWDPFHTSPEEWLGYVGLVPLFLALSALKGWRGDPATRSLSCLTGLTLVFSLGPYVPGFRWLIDLPGFSFFRAPARWDLATSLALTLLSGRGFDALAHWPKRGRGVRWFAVASLAAVVVVVLGFELAMLATKGAGWPSVASGFDRALQTFPWADRPESKPFRAVMAEAYRPQNDLRTQTALARLDGQRLAVAPFPTLARDRFAIYRRELIETGALLAAIVLLSSLANRRPRAFSGLLLVMAVVDGLIQARHRPFDLGPSRSLVAQSPVLARVAGEPRGTRTLDPARNLFQVAGVAPVSSYRTLDLPAPVGLLRLAGGPLTDSRVIEALRVSGVGLRIFDPSETRTLGSKFETIHDPALAGWLLGVDLASATSLEDFAIFRPEVMPARAWLLPAPGLLQAANNGMTNPLVLLERFRAAVPLAWKSTTPEHAEVEWEVTTTTTNGNQPMMVVLTTTYDPEWQAWWSSPTVAHRPATVEKVLGGWQGVVAVPEPGRWTLHLDYPGRGVWLGLSVSAVAWLVWLVGFVRLGAGRGTLKAESGQKGAT